MRVGDLVRCTDTGVIGMVAETSRGATAVYILVVWPHGNKWVDSLDVELVLVS